MKWMYFILLMTGLCLSGSLYAQKGYEKGYIVTHRGDTLQGYVKDRKEGAFARLYTKIRFKEEGARCRKKYAPEDIKAYMAGGRLYESIGLERDSRGLKTIYPTDPTLDRVFLQVINRGRLTLYHWEYMDEDLNDMLYIPLFYKVGEPEMVRVTQGLLGLKKKVLARYLSDCPDIKEKMDEKALKTPTEVMQYYRGCKGE